MYKNIKSFLFKLTFTKSSPTTCVKIFMGTAFKTVPLTKKQEAELAVAELKMLIFSLEVTRMNKIKNEFIIRGTAHVRQIGDKVREARLGWYGQV